MGDPNPAATCPIYGPYPGWTTTALAVGPDNAAHLLWDHTSGEIALWNLADAHPAATCTIAGPYTGWSGTAIGFGPDNHERLLWNNANGTAAVWNLADPSATASCLIAGPYTGWTANALGRSGQRRPSALGQCRGGHRPVGTSPIPTRRRPADSPALTPVWERHGPLGRRGQRRASALGQRQRTSRPVEPRGCEPRRFPLWLLVRSTPAGRGSRSRRVK